MQKPTKEEITKLKLFYIKEPWLKKERRFISEFVMEFGIYIIFLLMYAMVIKEHSKSLMVYIFLLYFGLRRNFRQKKETKIQERYKKLASKEFKHVQLRILELAKKMGIKKEIVFYYNKNNHYIPNILESKYGNIIMILPRNIFYLFNKNKKHFDAIIAHEFSHVIKHDTNLWWDFKRYKDLLLVLGLGTVAAWSVVPYNILFSFFIIYFFIYYIYHFPNLKRKRKKSELYADIASIIYTGHYGIIEVLNGNYIKDQESTLHPNIQTRLNQLNRVIKK